MEKKRAQRKRRTTFSSVPVILALTGVQVPSIGVSDLRAQDAAEEVEIDLPTKRSPHMLLKWFLAGQKGSTLGSEMTDEEMLNALALEPHLLTDAGSFLRDNEFWNVFQKLPMHTQAMIMLSYRLSYRYFSKTVVQENRKRVFAELKKNPQVLHMLIINYFPDIYYDDLLDAIGASSSGCTETCPVLVDAFKLFSGSEFIIFLKSKPDEAWLLLKEAGEDVVLDLFIKALPFIEEIDARALVKGFPFEQYFLEYLSKILKSDDEKLRTQANVLILKTNIDGLAVVAETLKWNQLLFEDLQRAIDTPEPAFVKYITSDFLDVIAASLSKVARPSEPTRAYGTIGFFKDRGFPSFGLGPTFQYKTPRSAEGADLYLQARFPNIHIRKLAFSAIRIARYMFERGMSANKENIEYVFNHIESVREQVRRIEIPPNVLAVSNGQINSREGERIFIPKAQEDDLKRRASSRGGIVRHLKGENLKSIDEFLGLIPKMPKGTLFYLSGHGSKDLIVFSAVTRFRNDGTPIESRNSFSVTPEKLAIAFAKRYADPANESIKDLIVLSACLQYNFAKSFESKLAEKGHTSPIIITIANKDALGVQSSVYEEPHSLERPSFPHLIAKSRTLGDIISAEYGAFDSDYGVFAPDSNKLVPGVVSPLIEISLASEAYSTS